MYDFVQFFCLMNWREVLVHPLVDRVVRVRGYSRNMAEHLAKAVANFCDFMGCGVDEALDKIRGMSGEEIVELFRDYFIERRPVLAPKTLWNWSNAVKIWLYENGVDVDPISKKITREYRRYVSHRGIPKLLKRDIIEKDGFGGFSWPRILGLGLWSRSWPRAGLGLESRG